MKNEKRYLIVASGTLHGDEKLNQLVERADVVVCADGGARHLFRLGHLPDLLMGDLDSIDSTHRDYFLNNDVKLIRYPSKKNATDTELAVDWAIDDGATEIILTAVTGTRLDHTLANIFLLKSIREKGVKARIVDDHNEICLISRSLFRFPGETGMAGGAEGKEGHVHVDIDGNPGEFLSIIPISETVTGVTLEGLEYPLENAELTLGSSRGISNVFKEKTARVSLREGTALITKSRDE